MLIYLDSSAIVKLVRRERETPALFDYLESRPDRVTSVVAAIEVPRVVRRATGSRRALARADRVLERIGLVELDASIRSRAAALEPTALRTLDAIHIATALDLGADVSSLVTYDERQAAAAGREGIDVASPGRGPS